MPDKEGFQTVSLRPQRLWTRQKDTFDLYQDYAEGRGGCKTPYYRKFADFRHLPLL
jgi:hypothetical protein